MPRTRAKLVHDGPHLQALVKRGTSRFVLVTFNARGFRADGRSFWAEQVVDKLELNAVGFVTKEPNWYPGEDFAAAMAAVRPHLAPFSERIGYGGSQGAYASIRASRPLALTATIAVSPQWSIDPADIVDDRYNKFFDPVANKAMALTADDAPRRLLILADAEFDEDKEHLRTILARMPRAELVPVPSSDHDTMRVLHGLPQFTAILTAVRAGGPLTRVVARVRRASPIRREVLIRRALARKQGARALGLFETGVFEPAEKATILLRFGRRGEAGRVVEHSRRHHREHPQDEYVKAVLDYVLAAVDHPVRARALHERAQEIGRRQHARRRAHGPGVGPRAAGQDG